MKEAKRTLSAEVDVAVEIAAEFVTQEELDAYIQSEEGASEILRAIPKLLQETESGSDIEAGWIDEDHEAILTGVKSACTIKVSVVY